MIQIGGRIGVKGGLVFNTGRHYVAVAARDKGTAHKRRQSES